MALRFAAQAVWIAQTAREDAPPAGRAVHLPDGRSVLLRFHSVFGDVAVRTDANIEQRSVRARDEALGPVMVDGAARPLGERSSLCRELCVALLIGVANDGVGIRDIKIVADERHAERRVEVIEENALHFVFAV